MKCHIDVFADVVDINDGVVTLAIPAVAMSVEKENMLKQLFPDLQDSVGLLLRKQAILLAII